MEETNIPSSTKSIDGETYCTQQPEEKLWRRESSKGRKVKFPHVISTFFHLKFGHASLNIFASCESFVNLLFCGMFLESIVFLYVYDIYFGLENIRRVLSRVLRIKIFFL